jgi:hypothetical protein
MVAKDQAMPRRRTIRVFHSFEDADKADKADYHSQTPAKRIEGLLILRDQYRPYSNELTEGFKRVCRVIKRS